MSKSKGNVIDPLELIEKYGADALRFTLTAFAAQGRDVKLSESRVEGYRNFCTKIWNAARFCEMNECKPVDTFDPAKVTQPLNKWIVGKVVECERRTREAIEAYRFNDIATSIYQFTWGTYCDWYLELVKPVLQGDDAAAKEETRATAAWALDQILMLAHPVIPFVTEELWQSISSARGQRLIETAWPVYDDALIDSAVNAEIDWVVRLITQIRQVRSEMNVPPSAKVPMFLKDPDAAAAGFLDAHKDLVMRLARLENAEVLEGDVPKGAVQDVIDEATIILPIAEVIDLDAERARLEREIAKQDKEIQRFEGKLGNEKFIANAPEEVIETERERLAEAKQVREKLEEAHNRLSAVG
ncbi:MAG: class I tRNA ligase family protein, partial [Oricola sp.]|nr:class I tRNA ligase family protein [Oricola sp.]